MKIPSNVEVVGTDLVALLFWASVGVNGSVGGSYEEDIVNIIESYGDYLKMKKEWDYSSPRFMTPTEFAAKKLGSLGGKASAKKLTKKQRKERATKASHSRLSATKH